MFSSREDSRSAILFFSSQGIVKELLYSEFEALLEGFTPEKEWIDKEAKAVYLELSADLQVKAAVFFVISFDSEGWVEASWNIPLVNLARTAKVNDVGLKAATAQNCSDPKYQEMLWNPDLSASGKVLGWISDAIAVNKLGFSRQAAENMPNTTGQVAPSAVSHDNNARAMEAQITQLMQHQTQGASDIAQAMAKLEETKAQYAKKLGALQAQLADKVRQFDSAKTQLEGLKSTLEGSEQKIAQMREHYESKLKSTQGHEADFITALREHYETEASEQIASAESEYKELLNWREVELIYRAEREAQLHDEMTQLKLKNTELALMADGDLLQTMSDKGITFMTYQVGLGHINIPVSEVPLYINNPIGFVAAYCKVSQAVYLDWLAHFHAPVCRIQDAQGGYCGADVKRMESPMQFMPGVSDCCPQHQNKA
ncbi:hypothetical protein [Marinagarivorans algicola]|uniref:hypothetical protein n=1 Tax=Marinagarivorans algicola TaxID=1513270 RepID=UPI0006B58497|nr:hypothetical protein [Marinagarivorans algicola]